MVWYSLHAMVIFMTKKQWQPNASLETLRARAVWIQHIRHFFTQRGYWEVETPILSHHGITDVYLRNITAHCLGQTGYLQTSPEYHMKRLLAAGSGPIFQISKVFRDDELGRWHNPEFTMLEWYQLDWDHHQLMQEVGQLLDSVLACGPLQKYTYRDLFIQVCGCDPFLASIQELQALLNQYQLDNVLAADEPDKDQYLFLLMTHVIEPVIAKLHNPVAVYGFPVSQAALAQLDKGQASRFEVYYRGVELANGFHELTDPQLQRERFESDQQQRRAAGFPSMDIDPRFIQALAAGLPPCSGVALGLDRLLVFACQAQRISEVLSFDWHNA